jgi:aspartate aminotransferase
MSEKIQVSQRTALMQESAIRKLVPLADQAKARGVKVYHLNIGQPDIETPPQILDNALAFKDRVVKYAPSPGEKSLVECFIRYYDKFCSISLDKSQILVTNGGSEAIIFAFMTVADPGDEIIVFEPFYTNYNGFATMAGVKLVPVTTYVENGFALPPMGEIRKKVTSKTRAILICNPNNPTGMVYSKERLQGLCDLALEKGLFILSDEVYREFTFDGDKHYSILDFPEISDRAVMMDSMSKRYSFCGGRIGCFISRNKDIMTGVFRLAMARLCVSSLDQYGALGIDNLDQAYYDSAVAEYKKRRDVVFEGLKKIEGAVFNKAPGAFYSMLRLPIDSAEKFAAWLLTDFNINNETVMISPAPGFYSTPGLGIDEIRIAYVLNSGDLEKGMDLLAAAVKEYNKVKRDSL